MADDYEPRDFSKLKINIDPIVKNNLEFTAGIKESMSAAVSVGLQDIIKASRMVLAPDIARSAESVSEPLRAVALAAENAVRVRASIELPTYDLTPVTSAMDSLFDGLRNQQSKAVQEVADSLKEMSTFNFATTINGAARAIDYSTNVPYKTDDLPVAEVPKEVVHEKLEKEAIKEKEETGGHVPYNALSMKFIMSVYLPCMDMYYTLENVETIDAEFAVKFIILGRKSV